MPRPKFATSTALLILAASAVATGAARLAIGPGGWAFPDSMDIWNIRGPRVAAGALVGVALGVAGVLMQCLLRNPLASPDLMGVASGASLAVMLATLATGASIASLSTGGWALAGSLLTLIAVYVLGQRRGRVDHVRLALVGVSVAFFLGSLAMLVQHLLADRGLSAMRWLMGSLSDDATFGDLGVAAGCVGLCVALARWLGPWMDASSMSDDEATSVGVSLPRLRFALFVTSGTLSAISVVLAGPLGFVGLAAPHIARWLLGPRHRTLVIGAALAGVTIVLGADLIVRLLDLRSGRLPLGVVTSILGAPVLVWMLRARPGPDAAP
ncbi:MAG: iron ABC transporter permease [Planctomycetota bacterium]